VFFGNSLRGEYFLIQEPYCRVCATPEVSTDRCTWHGRRYGFDRAFAMGLYYPSRGDPSSIGWDDYLSKHIRYLKSYPGYATPLGLGLSLCITKIYTELQKMDLIVPVPKFSTELKKAMNGSEKMYNQAMELSRVISMNTGIPYAEALEKLREQKMRGLAMDDRWAVVKGLYRVCDSGVVERRKVIVVDDVFTSGATVSECSDMLLRAGSECVNVLVAGRDTG
jgi:hypothetical protein